MTQKPEPKVAERTTKVNGKVYSAPMAVHVHQNIRTLFNHYRRAVRPADAAKFWAIVPACKSNLIELSKAV